MASANVVALQNAINRIARMGGFSRVTVDGGLGPETNGALLQALGVVSKSSPQDSTRAAAQGLIVNLIGADGAIDQTQVAQSATGLATFLGQAADELGAPPENAQPTVSSGNGGGALTPVTLPGSTPVWATSLITTLKALPTWQKLALGVAAGAGVIWLHKKIKHRSLRAA